MLFHSIRSSRILEYMMCPQILRIQLLAYFTSWVIAIPFGWVLAQYDPAGPDPLDKSGYSIFDDYISNLGSIDYTPFPGVLNIILILWAIFCPPYILYTRNILLNCKINRRILIEGFVGFSFIGNIGFGLAGFISFDVGNAFNQYFGKLFGIGWHETAALFAFFPFCGVTLCVGLLLLFNKDIFQNTYSLGKHKLLRIITLTWTLSFYPSLLLILSISFLSGGPVFGLAAPFWEWMLHLSFTAWYFPFICLGVNPIPLKSRASR